MKIKRIAMGLVSVALLSISPTSYSAENGNQKPASVNKKRDPKNVTPSDNSAPTNNDLLNIARVAKNNRSYDVALKIYLDLARQGNSEAQYRLGEMVIDGLGTSKDKDGAFILFNAAADQNHPFALEIVFEQAPELLIPKLQQIAERGNPDAQLLLGAKYAQGEGTAQNNEIAKKWINSSLTQSYCGDDYLSMLELLGIRYESGIGVAKDPNFSLAMRKKAVDCGYAKSATSIGKMYFSGVGVDRNQDEALRWFSKAISLGGETEEQSIKQYLDRKKSLNQIFAEIDRQPKRSRYGWRIGMSKEDVLHNSKEKPVRKNQFTNSNGTQEQWVYGNGWAYLYFNENGLLVSYQERETQ